MIDNTRQQKIRPRVDIKRKLVCVHHSSLNMFEVYKMTNKGLVNKRISPEFSYTDDVDEAFRNMSYPRAQFKTVSGLKPPKEIDTWHKWVEYVWQQANKK
jgi:hypothetical protein